jgi:tellurite resistance protein
MAPGSLPESHISVQIQAIMMNLKLFKVSGRVYQAESDIGIPNLIIEAFDKDVVKNDKLGQATTNSEGTFEITYSEADFKSKYEVLESNPDLYIVIKTPDLSQILYSSEKNIRRNVKSHEHFDVAIPQATLSANQQGLAKDNKQLLKLLVGIAWLDGELEPGEQEFLQRLANAKGLADDPEVQALLSVDRPVQPEECYGWLQAYLKSSSEDKDFQELYEAINSLMYSDGELDSQEKELLAELAATDEANASNRKLTLQRRFMSLMLDSKFLGNILQMERSSMVSQAAVGAGYYARVPYQVINRFSTTTQTKILAGDMAKLCLTDNFAPVKKEITANNPL